MSFLKVQITEETPTIRTVRGLLHDNTHFVCKVPYWDVHKTEEKEDGFNVGWLKVEHCGQRQDIVSITLPGPILDKGHSISVSATRMRRTLP